MYKYYDESYLRVLRNEYLSNQFKTGKVEQYHDELVLPHTDYATLEQRVLANMHKQSTKKDNTMSTHSITLESFIRDNTPEGMEYDKENSTLDNIVYKAKVKSTRWEDLKDVNGWYTNRNAYTTSTGSNCKPMIGNENIYATEPQCKAHLAQAKLSQIMKEVNGGWVADYTNIYQSKYALCLYEDGYYIYEYKTVPKFLTFKSQELAEQVLRENADLLEQYKPLAG